jgi:hypothetical protein
MYECVVFLVCETNGRTHYLVFGHFLQVMGKLNLFPLYREWPVKVNEKLNTLVCELYLLYIMLE